ncbi:cytochrome P450 [Bimuria novae-zelandiae CBS 107.79]|uniref:Cytochrome P450 n=1 Tax=Bimuria novae-zelandiae CBS 107.79 TaxID=1447943 RepID=A0A6A5UW31_9PLEO|nr:cytochrome P450 [Bimuria novae-zelandiae CBS 107.79]
MERVILPSTLGTLTVGLLLPIVVLCTFTYLTTLLRYHLAVRNASNGKGNSKNPPLLPYFIPVLGSTIAFSNQTVGTFWTWLRTQAERYHQDAFSIVLAGKRTHFIFSEDGISSLFKSRQLSRAGLDRQLGVNVLGMSKEDSFKAFPDRADEKTSTERLHSEYLLSSTGVHALTEKFIETLLAQLGSDEGLASGVEGNLYEWLWQRVFRASTTALAGSKLLEMYPDFDVDYRVWEDNMLDMLFGTPRLFARQAYRARDACVEKLERWLETGYQHTEEEEGEDPDWTPSFGARVMRKRHDLYKQRDLSIHGQAGWDLIFLAGILSNATPATGWLLLHILSPTSASDFRPRIMQELQSCKRTDGSIDIPALTRLPLVNSAFHEVLRLYVDLLLVRRVESSGAIGPHYVRQSEQVMAPTWMTHRNPAFFDRPDIFDPERFLTSDPETGKLRYRATGLGSKYFPFGGGHYMCPGRMFAKQEVLGTIAVLLLNFDITFAGFVKRTKTGWESVGTEDFPTIKNGFAGNQVVGIEGDMRVHIKRRPPRSL